jgi:hypothetical protein
VRCTCTFTSISRDERGGRSNISHPSKEHLTVQIPSVFIGKTLSDASNYCRTGTARDTPPIAKSQDRKKVAANHPASRNLAQPGQNSNRTAPIRVITSSSHISPSHRVAHPSLRSSHCPHLAVASCTQHACLGQRRVEGVKPVSAQPAVGHPLTN